MYEIKIIRRMWNLYKILCAPLFRMGRSLALLQRICKASNSGYERLTSFYQELQKFMKLKANLDFFPLQQYSINLDLR